MAKKNKKTNLKDKLSLQIKNHKILATVILLMVILVVVLGIISILDARKINAVNNDLETLAVTLRKNGFNDAKVTQECWKTQGKYGRGAKVCESEIKGSVQSSDFNLVSVSLITSIDETLDLKLNWQDDSDDDNKLQNKLKNYTHAYSNATCGYSLRELADSSLQYRFGCVTTPWYSKL